MRISRTTQIDGGRRTEWFGEVESELGPNWDTRHKTGEVRQKEDIQVHIFPLTNSPWQKNPRIVSIKRLSKRKKNDET